MGLLQNQFYALINERHPMMSRGIAEAREVAPEIVDYHFEKCLKWVVQAHGQEVLVKLADAYALYTLEVNRAQQAYEKRGYYECATFAEADARVYQQSEYMRDYYWGVFAILFSWSHYVELMGFFIRRFVAKLPSGNLIEIAPGHGAWGVLAVTNRERLTLEGWDISPTSIELAPKMAASAGVGDRCKYHLGDATKIEHSAARYDAAICSFMLEHLEEPGRFLADFAPSLRSGALAFVTLALTAAQTDHIYEFKRESEGILLAEAAGFELLECHVAQPQRLMPGARFVPRVQAMILRKK
jgi:2-polyprenyl-3-methyl-5-hydroxy-6-metoxy-1,4-benzoquinol methylase